MSNAFGKQLTRTPKPATATRFNQSPSNCASCTNSGASPIG